MATDYIQQKMSNENMIMVWSDIFVYQTESTH